MKIVKAVILLHFAAFFIFCQAADAANGSRGLESVKTTVESVLDVLNDEAFSGPEKSQERKDKIRSLISGRFDFREMSRRALARHWKKRAPEEQDEFVGLFSDLLQRTYINKIER